MCFFLTIIVLVSGGIKQLLLVARLFITYWRFWVLAGSVGFGGFYALICYSADFSPGWVIAATWQFTVVASLFVFILFGRSFPKKIWLFSLLIFLGVVLINLSHLERFDLSLLLSGGLPVLLAAFCYPFGNQLVWEAQNSNNPKLPNIESIILENVFNKVLLMTWGSLPLWTLLVLIMQPPPPSLSQLFNTSLVALFSGIIATGIFLYARGLASTSNELAGVDATQASEVVFALLGGIAFLGSELPNGWSLIGLSFVVVGLVLFIKYQNI